MSERPHTGSQARGADQPREPGPPALEELVRAAPGLARIALGAGWRSAAWTAGVYINTASRVVQAASRGESTADVLQETSSDLRAYARSLLGLSEAGGRKASGSRPASGERRAGAFSQETLQQRGAELLRASADVELDDASHPSYMRILEALAPDEARILRLLAQEGPQPSVDVRSGLPLASELIAPGCNMIGEEAGCIHLDRVRAYLDNLHRLGLIWFSREPVKDLSRYQVLEAQPEVAEARARGGRTARTVHRSILLTTFGEDFCAVCIPLEESASDVRQPVGDTGDHTSNGSAD